MPKLLIILRRRQTRPAILSEFGFSKNPGYRESRLSGLGILKYTSAMSIGEFLLEHFAGDLEYHPRRAALYLGLGVAAACFWVFSPPETRFTPIPLTFALGSLTLLIKGVFLLRKSSEGIGLSEQEVSELSNRSNRKDLPSLPNQVAQIVQDFGAGGMLLWPLLRYGKGFDNSWDNAPSFKVFVSGAFLFALGWLIRRLTSPPQP